MRKEAQTQINLFNLYFLNTYYVYIWQNLWWKGDKPSRIITKGEDFSTCLKISPQKIPGYSPMWFHRLVLTNHKEESIIYMLKNIEKKRNVSHFILPDDITLIFKPEKYAKK